MLLKKRNFLIGTLGIVMLVMLTTFSACSHDKKMQDESLDVIVTNFAEYDWVRSLLEGIDAPYTITFINEKSDLHGYEPSAADMAKIAESDILVYVGGESDEWIEDMLQQKEFSALQEVNLLHALGNRVLAEEDPLGYRGDDADNEEDKADDMEPDEHIWLSPKNALVCLDVLKEALNRNLDARAQEIVIQNTQEYRDELETLDNDYQIWSESFVGNELIFADRFPFTYMTNDYHVKAYAAFPGCSAETNASFATIKNLADVLADAPIKALITLEESDGNIAQSIIESSGLNPQSVRLVSLNSMQHLASSDIDHTSYLELMQANLETLESLR
ncbi:MAG: zinc ABC transporter substrate-binding protein [Eggerthellaceae bacterium]|nr:zinc ABC transporter substrate-binding protein [Eggerthellaceae bacterium]